MRTRAIPERLRGAFTTRLYTNPRLPLPLPSASEYTSFITAHRHSALTGRPSRPFNAVQVSRDVRLSLRARHVLMCDEWSNPMRSDRIAITVLMNNL